MKNFSKKEILQIVEENLSRHYGIDKSLLSQKGLFFVEQGKKKIGARLQIVMFYDCIVIIAGKTLLKKIRPIFESKSREEIFECPLVYGLTLRYLPSGVKCKKLSVKDYSFHVCDKQGLIGKDISSFPNAVCVDEKGDIKSEVFVCACQGDKVVGIAGAVKREHFEGMMEIGVDVLPEYRQKGLAVALLQRLTDLLLKNKIIPFYSVASTNLGSQAVASKGGYLPVWCDSFASIFDGSTSYDNLIRGMKDLF